MLLLFRYLLRFWHERKPGATDGQPSRESEPPEVARDDRLVAPVLGSARGRESPSPRSSAASRGPIGLLAHQVRYDLRASFRNPRARFLTFFFPIVMLVIFAGVFRGSTMVDGVHVKLSRYFVAGILAMSIVIAAYGNLLALIATLRESGVLKRRRATPVPPGILIAGQALSTVLSCVIIAAVLLAVAKILYGIGMSPGAIGAIVCTAILGALTFACIGYAISGLVGSPESAQPIVQATTMPLWFISGVLIPTGNLSSALRSLGSLFPVEHLAAGLHLASVHTSFASSVSVKDLLVLLAWGVAAAAFAAWRFDWLPSAAAE